MQLMRFNELTYKQFNHLEYLCVFLSASVKMADMKC